MHNQAQKPAENRCPSCIEPHNFRSRYVASRLSRSGSHSRFTSMITRPNDLPSAVRSKKTLGLAIAAEMELETED